MTTKTAKTYQQMSADLNELMTWFEGDKIDLDEAVDKFEQAMRLIAEMEDYLKTAENKVKKIATKFES